MTIKLTTMFAGFGGGGRGDGGSFSKAGDDLAYCQAVTQFVTSEQQGPGRASGTIHSVDKTKSTAWRTMAVP